MASKDELNLPRGANIGGAREAEIWAKFKVLCPNAERIENAISSGLPDIFFPTYHGWSWLELKMRYATYFYLQKSQLAFTVRIMRLSHVHWVNYLLYDFRSQECQLFTSKELLEMPRFPYDDKKLRVNINLDLPWMTLRSAVERLQVLG